MCAPWIWSCDADAIREADLERRGSILACILLVLAILTWAQGAVAQSGTFGRLKVHSGMDPIALWRSPDALRDGMTLLWGGASHQSARGLVACIVDPGDRVLIKGTTDVTLKSPREGTGVATILHVRVADGRYAGCQGWVFQRQVE